MATATASSASEPEVEPQARPEAEGEEDEAKPAGVGRKVLSSAETAKAKGPEREVHQEGVSESDGDEEDAAMASSAESSAGEDEWEYDEEEEKNQLEIERLEEQVGRGGRRVLFPRVPRPGPPPRSSVVMETAEVSRALSATVGPRFPSSVGAQNFRKVFHWILFMVGEVVLIRFHWETEAPAQGDTQLKVFIFSG